MTRKRVRRAIGGLLALLLLAGTGWALSQPPDPREQLAQFLLTQEELIETLEDDGWFIKTVDRLDPEPEGGVSVVATYANPNAFLSLVIGLIEFESRELLDRFVGVILEAPQIQGPPRDLLAEAQENPEVLPELLRQEAERVLLLALEREQKQLLFQRHTLLAFLRIVQLPQGELSAEEREALLIRVGERQLQKVLDLCAQLAEQAAAEEIPQEQVPPYCAPLEPAAGAG